ncbi:MULTISPECIES: acylphosphatase [unclassified Methanoculleus]|uniref:acylphosphatase n=1 Tax=unclassified Methanoculleus TaxID=2619537 RepID=UPI0025F94053|nr:MULTISPECIES: acylphosphatase [unclassified Methanoculleus]MCK9319654.1 acylphosphatase [Methanoculleus sp.]MDD2788930.1 acylphosphatase [Methanoculleus sp.]MDD3217513.1 acylphosphatase [Methanoculleus sp.]MDD4472295.1 acylphosphatase [Methanoculleus sp.]HOI59588.1 acylphosphatase [Methanoculleus sp.]
MKRFFAVAAGRVQRVGFRDHVYKETFNKDISGYVKNLDTGEVEIVAEGSEEDLRALIERINIIRYPIAVKSFSIKWQEATGEFTTFEIIRGDLQEELFERVDFAGTIMYQTLENSELSLKKQDQMLDKQDQMLQIGIETKDEVAGLRRDTRKCLDDEFTEIKKELAAIKGALSRAGIQV